jgi:hypothetical protein
MRLEPHSHGLSLTIGQQCNGPSALQINQHGPVGLAFAEREVVNTEDLWCAVAWEWQATDHA